ncbi:hypothetical protein, partial [Metabacillus sp. SLBN-84]
MMKDEGLLHTKAWKAALTAAILLDFSLLNPNRKTAQAGYTSVRQGPRPYPARDEDGEPSGQGVLNF